MNKYAVLFTKYFVNGNLQGLTYPTTVHFPTLDAASEYVAFLHQHQEKPVKAIDSSHYTCHVARIEAI